MFPCLLTVLCFALYHSTDIASAAFINKEYEFPISYVDGTFQWQSNLEETHDEASKYSKYYYELLDLTDTDTDINEQLSAESDMFSDQLLTAAETQSTTLPPNPVPKSQDKNYYLGTQKLTYYGATLVCQFRFMELVSIQNKEKNDAINSVLQKDGLFDYYWTSGNRISDQKTWTWSPNEKLEYSNWNRGEPNNFTGSKNCLNIFKFGTATIWNDAPCEEKNLYICESPTKPVVRDIPDVLIW